MRQIVQPDRYLDEFGQAGADLIIVHQEASVHLDRSIQHIKHLGKKAGVAICPATPVHVLDEGIEELDLVLVMTVNPRFGGQEFIGYTPRKIRQVREILDARNPNCEIEVDGVMQPLEMGHLPYKKGRAYEDYIGRAGLERLGKQRWRKEVAQVITELSAAMEPDYVVIGGGNAKYLKEMPTNCRLGANANTFEGGFRMWADAANRD